MVSSFPDRGGSAPLHTRLCPQWQTASDLMLFSACYCTSLNKRAITQEGVAPARAARNRISQTIGQASCSGENRAREKSSKRLKRLPAHRRQQRQRNHCQTGPALLPASLASGGKQGADGGEAGLRWAGNGRQAGKQVVTWLSQCLNEAGNNRLHFVQPSLEEVVRSLDRHHRLGSR